jgi:cell shape-determining protein MreC
MTVFTSLFAHATSNVTAGDYVIDDGGLYGDVTQVYANGKVKILLENTVIYVIRDTADLGKSCGCVEGICKGSQVVDNDNRTGEVINVFDNGTVRMLLTNSVQYQISSFSDLGMDKSCVATKSCRCN